MWTLPGNSYISFYITWSAFLLNNRQTQGKAMLVFFFLLSVSRWDTLISFKKKCINLHFLERGGAVPFGNRDWTCQQVHLQWKRGVLPTGLPWKSTYIPFYTVDTANSAACTQLCRSRKRGLTLGSWYKAVLLLCARLRYLWKHCWT